MRIPAMLPLVVLACADPTKDKPAAEVTAPAPRAAAPAPSGGAVALSPANTKIEFVGSKVTGSHKGAFERFSGKLHVAGEKPETSRVEVEIDAASVRTDNPKLDGHLRSPDFFDVEKHPKAHFVSTGIAPAAGGTYTVTGTLDLHGVKKQITFPADIRIQPDRLSVRAEFSINRKDFGVVYPGAPDDLIRDDVLLTISVDASRGT